VCTAIIAIVPIFSGYISVKVSILTRPSKTAIDRNNKNNDIRFTKYQEITQLIDSKNFFSFSLMFI
jgi:hypothetical protein